MMEDVEVVYGTLTLIRDRLRINFQQFGLWSGCGMHDNARDNEKFMHAACDITKIDMRLWYAPKSERARGLSALHETGLNGRGGLLRVRETTELPNTRKFVCVLLSCARVAAAARVFSVMARQPQTARGWFLPSRRVTVALLFLLLTYGALAHAWWNTNFQRRVRISFNNAASSSALNNFPVLLRLNSSTCDFTHILVCVFSWVSA